jgi:hypothetical protein
VLAVKEGEGLSERRRGQFHPRVADPFRDDGGGEDAGRRGGDDAPPVIETATVVGARFRESMVERLAYDGRKHHGSA